MKCKICGAVSNEFTIVKKFEIGEEEVELCTGCSRIATLEEYFDAEYGREDIDLVLASKVLKHLKNIEKRWRKK